MLYIIYNFQYLFRETKSFRHYNSVATGIRLFVTFLKFIIELYS